MPRIFSLAMPDDSFAALRMTRGDSLVILRAAKDHSPTFLSPLSTYCLHLRPKSFNMKKLFTPILLLLATSFLFAFISVSNRASFTGDWKLNESKSELGDFGGRFAARSIKVEQKDDAITISKTSPSFQGGDVTTTETLTFDGKESETTVFGSSKKKSVATWSEDGTTMTVKYTIAFERDGQTTELKGTETWSLTKEGGLSVVTNSSSPRGDLTVKCVYDK